MGLLHVQLDLQWVVQNTSCICPDRGFPPSPRATSHDMILFSILTSYCWNQSIKTMIQLQRCVPAGGPSGKDTLQKDDPGTVVKGAQKSQRCFWLLKNFWDQRGKISISLYDRHVLQLFLILGLHSMWLWSYGIFSTYIGPVKVHSYGVKKKTTTPNHRMV